MPRSLLLTTGSHLDVAAGCTRRKGTRPKRCTRRRVVKLTPRQDQMLVELARVWEMTPSELLKRLIEQAHHRVLRQPDAAAPTVGKTAAE